MQFTTTWTPATIAKGKFEGLTVGRFLGDKVKQITIRETGEIKELNSLMFLVKGQSGENKEIELNVSRGYNPDNSLGKVAAALGFVLRSEVEEDEYGQEIQTTNNLSELFEMLNKAEKEKTPFVFKMRNVEKTNDFGDKILTRLWEFDPTVAPQVLKTK
ncbi:hypothetical protein IQ235_13625 [Oscillatoriales cyanobacterium LEGE 11467]|uniref:Uncharacterized protein n=1 Tax=Zarconia navalis LEGE 11467 TaxID=1828826 RepID=A0A928W237_9CYAN|nr:hypothetical protein [Zarconia navalis]MBE9041820.1 hypothetical protein [Zarconia navalis LEGE 11467]